MTQAWYDAQSRQRRPTVQTGNSNEFMRNIQVNKLRQVYPQAVLFNEDHQTKTQTYRVPFMLPISPTPLYVKCVLGSTFP